MNIDELTPYECAQRIAELKRHLLTLPPHQASGTRERLERQIAALEKRQRSS